MISKDSLTKVFIQQAGLPVNEVNLKFYKRKWWNSVREKDDASFRLTQEGYEFLTETLNLNKYTIKFENRIQKSPTILLYLNRHINCPFFLEETQITVFSEKMATELALFASDINKYGLSKILKNKK